MAAGTAHTGACPLTVRLYNIFDYLLRATLSTQHTPQCYSKVAVAAGPSDRSFSGQFHVVPSPEREPSGLGPRAAHRLRSVAATLTQSLVLCCLLCYPRAV